jgi:hypothetical protein
MREQVASQGAVDAPPVQLAQPGRETPAPAALVPAGPAVVSAVDELVRSPEWLPIAPANGDALRLVRLDEAAYRAASFLDRRLLGAGCESQRCAPATLALAAAQLVPRANYVFHIGHVGSTLISRLIGEHPGFFAVREPALLRELTADTLAHRTLPLHSALALLSRTWRASQRAVIKATSYVSELAEGILAGPERPVGILLYSHPPAYLRTILAGRVSRREIREFAAARLRRLTQQFEACGWRPEPRSEGEYVAMSWLCEMSALRQAALRFPNQVLWVEFDAFLGEPAHGLDAIFRALGNALAARDVEVLVTGPLMRQYSKAPECAYDAGLRRQVLESAGREHAVEIGKGMDWLQAAAARGASLAGPG